MNWLMGRNALQRPGIGGKSDNLLVIPGWMTDRKAT